ncbi:Mov34/MPN/PAD-1 family protein [Tsuneonella rigui]|uniref:Mov34/MPN/PAD-1 family protein n=1 Tax=Tsuneonella rigui TaxID=1708790 RepID=UPI0019D0EC8E
MEIGGAIEQGLLALADSAYPLEACGLLLGVGDRITEARSCSNVHPEPTRHFEIDPQALIDAHRAERGGGPSVLGSFHSHPSGPPEPSVTDRAHATGDGRVWAIVGEGKVGWWRDTPDGFQPLSYAPCDR